MMFYKINDGYLIKKQRKRTNGNWMCLVNTYDQNLRYWPVLNSMPNRYLTEESCPPPKIIFRA